MYPLNWNCSNNTFTKWMCAFSPSPPTLHHIWSILLAHSLAMTVEISERKFGQLPLPKAMPLYWLLLLCCSLLIAIRSLGGMPPCYSDSLSLQTNTHRPLWQKPVLFLFTPPPLQRGPVLGLQQSITTVQGKWNLFHHIGYRDNDPQCKVQEVD